MQEQLKDCTAPGRVLLAAALHDIRQHFARVGGDKHGPIPFIQIIYWSIKRLRERRKEGGRVAFLNTFTVTQRETITHDALLPALLLINCDLVSSSKLDVCSILK